MSICFSQRISATGRPVFMHFSPGRRHSPPSRSFPREHSLVKTPRHSVVLLLAAESGPSASASPTRTACWPLSQRSMRLVILAQISWSRRTPNVFVSTTRANTRGMSDFQLRDITPGHSATRIAVKRRPTAPEGVAYQLANCAASWRQRRCHAASSAIPPSRCVPSL